MSSPGKLAAVLGCAEGDLSHLSMQTLAEATKQAGLTLREVTTLEIELAKTSTTTDPLRPIGRHLDLKDDTKSQQWKLARERARAQSRTTVSGLEEPDKFAEVLRDTFEAKAKDPVEPLDDSQSGFFPACRQAGAAPQNDKLGT